MDTRLRFGLNEEYNMMTNRKGKRWSEWVAVQILKCSKEAAASVGGSGLV